MADVKRISMIDRISEHIDKHVRLYRTVPWVLGGLGVILFCRSTNIFAQFKGAHRIPISMIKNNKALYGIVTDCYHDNSLGVRHLPIGNRLIRLKTKPPKSTNPLSLPQDECLVKVKFAGVSISATKETNDWLKETLLGQAIHIKLLHYDYEANTVESIVYAKKRFGRWYNMNKYIISTGNGSITDCTGFKDDLSYRNFVTEMSKTEVAAQRKAIGIWNTPDYMPWWRKIYNLLKR